VRRKVVVPSLHKIFMSIIMEKVFCKYDERLIDKLEPYALSGAPVGEEISPAGWRIAPTLNPKERRGLSVLLATGLVDQHTRAREDLEWFGPPERNTLLHCVMYCLGACMNLRVSA
jgi:hypothetical protein